MQFFNRRGRGRSRDEVIWIFFSSCFKVSLLYHLLFKEDVFNNSFWKICIKITNHVEPGLNLLESSQKAMRVMNGNVEVTIVF